MSAPPTLNENVQLITYVDRLGGGGFRELTELLDGPLDGLFGGVHLLPFYDPIDGADAGFDPVDHSRVDTRLGDWNDLDAVSRNRDLVADLIVNHVSSASPQFQDFLAYGDESVFAGMFLMPKHVFPGGPKDEDIERIYRPRATPPFTTVTLSDGSERRVWTTFTKDQIDIDVHDTQGREYLTGILRRLSEHGVKLVRLDAVGYAIKTAGTSCFMTPETFIFIEELTQQAHDLGMAVLVEVHSHFETQIDVAQHVDRVYDFALPPLILHALHARTAVKLKHWFGIGPRNSVSVLDTHDGIGVIDVGPRSVDEPGTGLLDADEIDWLVETIHRLSNGTSRLATGAVGKNVDLYQVNCTYFDALGRDENAYLLARLIQFFAPGIPQVYYVGLLAGENDVALFRETGVGRDINRHYYTRDEIDRRLAAPVVKTLLALIRFRNRHPAFSGTFELLPSVETVLKIRRHHEDAVAELAVDLEDHSFVVRSQRDGETSEARDFDDLCTLLE